ncbi:hypothetical protein K435DRAFT_392248 [Dendrothele bispora CBS 962.96]|uniref:Uncharacterized protein n=1 Tax=Dendrothele bispora (strain CBS 962.96) TaxID=1314807 RepID=A0A4S8MG02_DENBC|nr:hypothetical protein K435DRAFT_392248 [Dendrothele bispora CBS 962.96]
MSHLHALLLRISTLSSLKSFFNLPSNDLSQHGVYSFPLLGYSFFLLFHSESLAGLVSPRSSLTLHFRFSYCGGSTFNTYTVHLLEPRWLLVT